MVLIDSSVWIDYFRGNKEVVPKVLHLLDLNQVMLANPVYLELLIGAKKSDYPIIKRVMTGLPRFNIEAAHWDSIAEWIFLAKKNGDQFTIVDLLIAAVAFEQKCVVWSLDKDFMRMAKLGIVELMKL